MNWRFLLVIMISVGIHLTLLAIRFQSNGNVAVGERNLIGLVSVTLAQFSPADTNDQSAHSAKQGPAPRQPQLLSQVRNIPSHIQRLSKTALATTQAVAVPAEMLESRIAEEVSLEPVSSEPLKTLAILNVEVQNNPLSENVDVASVVSFRQDQASRVLLSEGVAKQVLDLTHAVPRYAENPRPMYPEVARRKGWAGEVRLLVLVDEIGDVDRISIDRSSGYSALDRAARRAVRLWRFVPATEAGRKIASEVVVPIDFRLPASDH